MNDSIKRKRGRPKNSFSFTEVTLAELNMRFRADEKIKVGKIFWESGQTKVHPSQETKITAPIVAENPAVEMTLTLD